MGGTGMGDGLVPTGLYIAPLSHEGRVCVMGNGAGWRGGMVCAGGGLAWDAMNGMREQ